MNRHINALVNYLVFAFMLGVFAGIFAHLVQLHAKWDVANVFSLLVLCTGCVGLLALAIHEVVLIRRLKAKYATVL